MQKCENEWRNLAEFLNAERCNYRIPKVEKSLFMVALSDSKGAQMCKSCRSRQELSNASKFWRQYSRGRVSQSLPQNSKQLEGTLEKTAKGLGKAPGAKAPLAKAPGAKAPAGKAPLAAKAGKGAGKGAGPPLSEDQVHSDP